ncbi:unnamed protein product, partial [marine sediment metagenome]
SGISGIINAYSREAGVRGLENNLKKILRKVALKVATEKEQKKSFKITVNDKNIEPYLGKPIFTSDVYYKTMPIGVCTGLAWTSMGGATLYVESSRASFEKTSMRLTGQAGDVMKESAQIAWSYLHSQKDRYAPSKPFFEKQEVHIHIPEGATPKDGPSAGITMVSSILSLLLEIPVSNKIAMTGEITLKGRILPIGGLKEKLIAARRAKIKTLIFPKENYRDYDELPKYLKKGIKVHLVEHYDEVFKILWPKKKLKILPIKK